MLRVNGQHIVRWPFWLKVGSAFNPPSPPCATPAPGGLGGLHFNQPRPSVCNAETPCGQELRPQTCVQRPLAGRWRLGPADGMAKEPLAPSPADPPRSQQTLPRTRSASTSLLAFGRNCGKGRRPQAPPQHTRLTQALRCTHQPQGEFIAHIGAQVG